MKLKIVKSDGCTSAVSDDKYYFAEGKGTLNGSIYHYKYNKHKNKYKTIK